MSEQPTGLPDEDQPMLGFPSTDELFVPGSCSGEGQHPSSHSCPQPSQLESIKLMAQNMKTLMGKIQDLQHLGIEDSKIALPRICVIGDQSTGKSSLIEAMSEIKVPRSAGTCTRCPLEINLSETEDKWSCKVILTRKYMYDTSKKLTYVTKAHPLGPWISQQPEDEVFKILCDIDQVQEALKWAQVAILNPRSPTERFRTGQNGQVDPKSIEVKFSPNVVRLDISGPGYPNLSFYDLPGVISQTEFKTEDYLIRLVENLVKDYISNDNCIVLLASAMTNDSTNSRAARIIRDTKGAAERTLCVLTKPDRIELSESLDQWSELLEGKTFAFGLGYYVVKNNPDPGVSHTDARAEEALFFASAPWNASFQNFHHRFGMTNLRSKLSRLLYEQIQSSLPKVISQIHKKANCIGVELAKLPPPVSGKIQHTLSGLLRDLNEAIRSHIGETSNEHQLRSQWMNLVNDFALAIEKTRPTIKLLAESESFLVSGSNSDGESDVEVISMIVKTPTKRQRSGDASGNNMKPRLPTIKKKYHNAQFAQFTKPAKKFKLEDIRSRNEGFFMGAIHHINPRITEDMNKTSLEHWDKPMKVFLDCTYQLVNDMIITQIKRVFLQYSHAGVHERLLLSAKSFLSAVQLEHYQTAIATYNIEKNQPFTMAQSWLVRAQEEAFQSLVEQRRFKRAMCLLKLENRLPDRNEARQAAIQSVSDQEIGPDEYSKEVKMMADVRGYYEVASRRFVDTVCQSVHIQLFSKCREKFLETIEEDLGLLKDDSQVDHMDRCVALMTDDPARQRRRQVLMQERDKLTQALDRLATEGKEDHIKADPDDQDALDLPERLACRVFSHLP